MSKRTIPVATENELIRKLNSNLKEPKTYVSAPEVKEVEDNIETAIYKELTKKYGYAAASPITLDSLPKEFSGMSTEAIEHLSNVICPKAKKINERIDACLQTKEDNDECRKTINNESLKDIRKLLNSNPVTYEMVNHPTHYNNYDKEVIDMIESIWGTYLAKMWCYITAFKYRMRMGTKPGNSIDQDLKKEKWYLEKASELAMKEDTLLNTNNE